MKLFGLLVAAGAVAWGVEAQGVEKVRLSVVRVDSEETAGEDARGEKALDGDADTFWHTQWQDSSPAHPHEIVVQVEPAVRIKGISYLPRQGESENGAIKDFEVYVSEDAKDFGQAVRKGTFEHSKEKQVVVFDVKPCKFVRLVALSEMGGQPWTSVAELGVVQEDEKVAVKRSLSVVSVDSEETSSEDGKGANALDGNPETIWHTQWGDASPGCPHEIVIKLDSPGKVKGLTYLPRQDGGDHGNIKDFEVYVSADGKDFGQPVAKGSWENNAEKKSVSFEAKAGSFVKLKALAEVNGEAWTSAAEIGVVTAEE